MPQFHQGPRRALRTGGLLTGLALTGILATATPAAAQASTTLTTSPWRATRTIGTEIRYVFTLTSGSHHVPGKTIKIYTRPTTSTTWTYRWTKTLNSYGQVAVPFTVSRSLYVYARFGGTTGYAASKSEVALVTAVSSLGKQAVTEAARHQGAPYQYGAEGPSRFDCSGFTRYVFGRFGRSLPHNSGQQYGTVRHIAKSSKQIGDLIFFYGSSGIDHVGIYAGNGYIWHSPHSGTVVSKTQIWTSSYYVGRVS